MVKEIGAVNTLPLELQAMQTHAAMPVIYALGRSTTGNSALVILIAVAAAVHVRRQQDRNGSAAGNA